MWVHAYSSDLPVVVGGSRNCGSSSAPRGVAIFSRIVNERVRGETECAKCQRAMVFVTGRQTSEDMCVPAINYPCLTLA